MDERAYSDAVAAIYDAAFDDGLWPAVATRIAGLVGRQQVCLESLDYQTHEASLLAVEGYDTNYVLDNLTAFIENDPWAAHVPQEIPGNVLCGHDFLPENERKRSVFVNEIAPEAGLATHDIVIAFLNRQQGNLGIERFGALIIYSEKKQGHFTEDDVHRLRLLRPHLVNAARIKSQLQTAAMLASVRDHALENARAGMWVLNAAGRVVHMNAKGRQQVAAGHCRVERNQLSLREPSAQERLTAAITRCAAHRGKSEPLTRATSFEMRNRQGGAHLIVSVVPVTSPGQADLLGGSASRSYVLVSIADQAPDLSANLAVIAGTYGLTPAEQRVLAALISGDSLREIAEHGGVSLHTVRTQLKSILAKTGARSQVDLANRVHNAV